ncbi:MAG: type II toxin-antitoxin system HicB family antitoxin [Methylobacteriaceae bacterium]|nr:type II toxin-antitoxin system HicB family antitoxin [Methylobacteriaceae bacterium]
MARYTALIDGKEGAYGIVFPDLPGCTAMGRTIEDALDHAAVALRDMAQWMAEDGEGLPSARPPEALRRDPDVAAALAEGATLASVPLVRATGRPAKANLSIDAGILAAIDEEAARRKLTRSAFIELLAKHALGAMA